LKRISEALNNVGKPIHGSKIAILGVAYKPDVDVPRESPLFVLLERLLAQGAQVTYNDPQIPLGKDWIIEWGKPTTASRGFTNDCQMFTNYCTCRRS
jgi:UDP-N-acetyl-D-mannosaminuronate dehydrogenase